MMKIPSLNRNQLDDRFLKTTDTLREKAALNHLKEENIAPVSENRDPSHTRSYSANLNLFSLPTKRFLQAVVQFTSTSFHHPYCQRDRRDLTSNSIDLHIVVTLRLVPL